MFRPQDAIEFRRFFGRTVDVLLNWKGSDLVRRKRGEVGIQSAFKLPLCTSPQPQGL